MANVSAPTTQQQNVAGVIYSTGYNLLAAAFGSTQGGLLAAMMVAQSKNEAAYYTSNVFKKYANAFGYGFKGGSVYKDYTLQIKIDYGATDVANWIIKRKADFANVKTCYDYAAALYKNDYFEGEPATQYAADMQVYYVPPTGIVPVIAGYNWKLAFVAIPAILTLAAAIKLS